MGLFVGATGVFYAAGGGPGARGVGLYRVRRGALHDEGDGAVDQAGEVVEGVLDILHLAKFAGPAAVGQLAAACFGTPASAKRAIFSNLGSNCSSLHSTKPSVAKASRNASRVNSRATPAGQVSSPASSGHHQLSGSPAAQAMQM